MLKITNKHKGAISVFMAIVYLWVFVLMAVLVDGGRIRLAEMEAEQAQQMANESAMTVYNQALYQYYDLFGESSIDTDGIKSMSQDFMQTMLSTNAAGSLHETAKLSLVSILQDRKYFDPYDLKIDSMTVGSNMNLAMPGVFRSQVEDSMKYKGPVYLAENFFDILGKLGSVNEVSSAVDNSVKASQPVYDKYGEYYQLLKELEEDINSESAEDKESVWAYLSEQDIYARIPGHPNYSFHDVRMLGIDPGPNPYNKEHHDENAYKYNSIIYYYICYMNDIDAVTKRVCERLTELEESDEEDYEEEEQKILTDSKEEKQKLFTAFLFTCNEKIEAYLNRTKEDIDAVIDEEDGFIVRLEKAKEIGEELLGTRIVKAKSEISGNIRGGSSDPDDAYRQDANEVYSGFHKNLEETEENVRKTQEIIELYLTYFKTRIAEADVDYDQVNSFIKTRLLPSYETLSEDYLGESLTYERSLAEDEDEEEDGNSEKEEDKQDDKKEEPEFGPNHDVYINEWYIYSTADEPVKIDKILFQAMHAAWKEWDKLMRYIRVNDEQYEDLDKTEIGSGTKTGDVLNKVEGGENLKTLDDQKTAADEAALTACPSGHKLGRINGSSRPQKTKDVHKKSYKGKDSVGAGAEERRDLIAGLADTAGNVLENSFGSLLESAYVMSYFRDYVHTGRMTEDQVQHNTSKENDFVLNRKYIVDESRTHYLTPEEFKKIEVSCAEAEYVLYGNPDTSKDVAAAYAEIFAVRLAMDYVSVWMTAELRSAVLTAAGAAGPFAPLVIGAMPLAFSIPRAGVDMQLIMKGKTVPILFIKMDDWIRPSWPDNSMKAGYGDYLLLFLLVDLSGARITRMQNVIETNMQAIDSDFSLEKSLVDTYIHTDCSVDYRLTGQLWMPPGFRMDGRHRFSIDTAYSY